MFKHPLAFVPTMGALHAGHESLIKLARSLSENVVVSIFVNPLQFDNPEDLAKYPKTLQTDTEKALSAGATQVWSPTEAEIYPGPITKLSAGPIGAAFEGASRPGHFDGMLTVVKRLFDIVEPQWAIFGEKDFQQLVLVEEMVRQYSLPIQIVRAPLVRESDGLALSSRNIRLGEEGHRTALVISKALMASQAEFDLQRKRQKLHEVLASEPGFTLDYAEIIDEDNFEIATSEITKNRALVAGWVNGVRLLDNMVMPSVADKGV